MKGEPSPPRVSDGLCEAKWCVSFPLKPTPRSRATGQEGGGQADGWPRPLAPSSDRPDTKETASDNTNSTAIGADGSQSASNKGRRDYRLAFFCSLGLIEEGAGGVV